jgi:hypothetical protein
MSCSPPTLFPGRRSEARESLDIALGAAKKAIAFARRYQPSVHAGNGLALVRDGRSASPHAAALVDHP